MTDLPFDPEAVPVKHLAERLEAENVDEETVRALQDADTRKGAEAVYERRVDAIRGSQDEAEEPVDEPPPPSDDDLERGYRITSWAGHPNYECLCGHFNHLDESKVIRHRAAQHP